jgi:hypothetical protein
MLPTPFPIPPPDCTIEAVWPRLLDTLDQRPKPEQEAILQAMGRLIAAEHDVLMFDVAYREWSEAHRISPELERKIRLHMTESESFLQ